MRYIDIPSHFIAMLLSAIYFPPLLVITIPLFLYVIFGKSKGNKL